VIGLPQLPFVRMGALAEVLEVRRSIAGLPLKPLNLMQPVDPGLHLRPAVAVLGGHPVVLQLR